jgi:hypothetical protein
LYLQGNQLTAVDVRTDSETFEVGSSKPLFEAAFRRFLRNNYLVLPDGQKFLVNAQAESRNPSALTLVLNWPAALRQ